jgi:predicted lipid-binding transport protein (Tim44 family)
MRLQHLMPRLFTVLLTVVLTGVFSFDAEARRLGGGKSLGRQSSNVTQREAAPAAAPAAPTAARADAAPAGGAAPAAAAATRKPWGSMLGGLAAGLGLAWLANALGLGPAFGNFLLLALLAVVVFAVIGMIRRTRVAQQNPLAYQGASASGAPDPIASRQYNPTKIGNDASARPWEDQTMSFDARPAQQGESMIGSALRGTQSWGVPAGFDTAGFIEASKRNFVTLQDAWDRSDIPALRVMMTDDMLKEIQSQLADRERQASGQTQKTEVLSLDAKLLGIEETADVYMASVEFSGVLREDASAGPCPFREVWNITKPRAGQGGWLVAGVQALQ